MPPSVRAIFRSGKCRGMFDHRRSAAAWQMFMGWSVIITSTGALPAGTTSWPDEPRWIDTHHVELGAGLPQRVPVALVEAREAERRGVLGEGDRVAALGGGAAHLGHAEVDVPQRRDGHRDHAVGVGAAPLVDVPVVVGPEHREGEVLVGGVGEEPAGERGEAREVHRAEHAGGAHVLDPLVEVPGADPDLLEGGGLDAELAAGLAGDGVEPDVGDDGVVVDPHVVAVGGAHDLRRLVPVLLRDVGVEQRRRLDHVVVDADEDQVVEVHSRPPCRALGRRVGDTLDPTMREAGREGQGLRSRPDGATCIF